MADPKSALDWLRKRSWGPGDKWGKGKIIQWEEDERGQRKEWSKQTWRWTQNVEALRTLDRQLQNKRTPDQKAWQIAREYLSLLQPSFGWISEESKWSVDFRLWPTHATYFHDIFGTGKSPSHRSPFQWGDYKDDRGCLWDNEGEGFWQIVFHSLFEEIGPVLCETCGRELGETTPKGRKRKQSQCSTCRHKKWKRTKTKKEMKKTWHDYWVERKKENASGGRY